MFAIQLAAKFLSFSDYENVVTTCSELKQKFSKLLFFKDFEKCRRVKLFFNVRQNIRNYFDDHDDFVIVNFLRDKILNQMPFYQIMSITDQWPEVSRILQRNLNKKLKKVLYIDILHRRFLHFPSILLSSSLSPGIFWRFFNKYVFNKIFVEWPCFANESPVTQKILVKFFRMRGTDQLQYISSPLFVDTIIGARRLAARFEEYKEWDDLMADYWSSLPYIISRYSGDRHCHLPLTCSEFQDCFHVHQQSMYPPTDLFNNHELFEFDENITNFIQ